MRFRLLTIAIFLLAASLIFMLAPNTQAQDALGIRVLQNPEHLSPLAWYNQQVAAGIFAFGNPQPIQVDGYEAIQDGRTVYVNAANLTIATDGTQSFHTNIYLISYNAGALDETIEIFNQSLVNWKFNANLANQALKERLQRDTKRLADLQDIRLALEGHKNRTGSFPNLAAGSFIRHVSFSAWPSWQATLGNALGTAIPQDPTNKFTGCVGETVDPTTCWSERQTRFQQPCSNTVYGYQVSPDGQAATLYTNFELPAVQFNLTGDVAFQPTQELIKFIFGEGEDFVPDCDSDNIPNTIDNCLNAVNPSQADSDGDCAVLGGKECGDACDTCPFDAENDWDGDGLCADVDNCPRGDGNAIKEVIDRNPDQTDTDQDGIGDMCDIQTCGDGVLQPGEECKVGQTRNCDTELGVRNWHTPTSQSCLEPPDLKACRWPSQSLTALDCGGYCGDDTINGPELCDGQATTANSVCSPDCTSFSCVAEYHREGIICVRNECLVSDKERPCTTRPPGSTGGVEVAQTCNRSTHPGTWENYSACTGFTCLSGFHEENGVCTPNACDPADQERACITRPANTAGGVEVASTCDTSTHPGVWKSFSVCSGYTCSEDSHLENGECALNQCPPDQRERACVAQPANTVGGIEVAQICNTKTNPGTWENYAECTGWQCQDGFRFFEGVCERSTCEGPAVTSCTVPNGVGTRTSTCNVNLHPPQYAATGACQLTSCNLGFHQEGNECVSNQRECPILNGVGGQNWNTQTNTWGECSIAQCNQGFHQEGDQCVPSTRKCVTQQGIGEQLWSNGVWGQCNFVRCHANFTEVNGVCTRRITSSGSHTLAVDNNGGMWVWGSNSIGQLGDGTRVSTDKPLFIIGMNGTNDIAVGQYHSMALHSGRVFVWGSNKQGQLTGRKPIVQANTNTKLAQGCVGASGQCVSVTIPAAPPAGTRPRLLTGLGNVVAIAAGDYTSYALLANGTVWSWGKNNYGQLGIGHQNESPGLNQVEGLNNIVSISAVGRQAHALRSDGTVWVWGYTGSAWHVEVETTPKQLTRRQWEVDRYVDRHIENAIAIDNGSIVRADGRIATFNGISFSNSSDPKGGDFEDGFTSSGIAASCTHALYLRDDKTVAASGNNRNGQIGVGYINTSWYGCLKRNRTSKTAKIEELEDIVAVHSGGRASYAIKSDGTFYAWGAVRNALGNRTDRYDTRRPVQIIF